MFYITTTNKTPTQFEFINWKITLKVSHPKETKNPASIALDKFEAKKKILNYKYGKHEMLIKMQNSNITNDTNRAFTCVCVCVFFCHSQLVDMHCVVV